MIRRRTRDQGTFHQNRSDCLIPLVMIVILAAVAIPGWLKFLHAARGKTCLSRLAARAADPASPEATCPFSGGAYVVTPTEEGEALACPEPKGHLDSVPRFIRAKDGSRRLRQTLPAYAGAPVELAEGGWEITELPGRLSILVKPSWYGRYLFGPIFSLLLICLFLYCASRLFAALRRRSWGRAALCVAGLLLWGSLGAFAALRTGGSRELVVERGRVVEVAYVFGARRAETVYEGCVGVVPIPGSGSAQRLLQLVHAPDAGGSRCATLAAVPAARLDVADWIHRTLLGPDP